MDFAELAGWDNWTLWDARQCKAMLIEAMYGYCYSSKAWLWTCSR